VSKLTIIGLDLLIVPWARVGRRIGYLYDGTSQLGAETIASYAKSYYLRFKEED